MKSSRWFLGLLFFQIAQAQEPIAWTLVGALNDDVAALFSVTSYESRLSLDAAILLRQAPGSPREVPDPYHPDGGALLWSHSVYYETTTHAVWVDGKVLLHLDPENVVMLTESEQPGRPPTIVATEFQPPEIGSGKSITLPQLRELLMRQDSIREFADAPD